MAAAAAETEGDLNVEALWKQKSPHRWCGQRRRAGAYVKARAFIVRLEAAQAEGDQATFEALLRLNVEAVSGGRRSKVIGVIHTYCPEAVLDAVLELALASRLPLREDVVGGDLAFWHALLHQINPQALEKLVDGGLDPARMQLNDDIESGALGEAVDKLLEDVPAAVNVVAYLAGLGVFDLAAGDYWGCNPFTSALIHRKLGMARALHAAGGWTTAAEWDVNDYTEALCRWIHESPDVVSVLHAELGVDIAALGRTNDCSTVTQRLAKVGSMAGLQALVGGVELPPEQIKAAAYIACTHGDEALLFFLLEHLGAGIDEVLARSEGTGIALEATPFAVAITRRQFALARALLQRGANPRCGGSAILFLLAAQGNVEGLHLLMDEGAVREDEVDSHVNFPSVQQVPGRIMAYVAVPFTPMQVALHCGAPGLVATVSCLLRMGADPARVQAFNEQDLLYKSALRAALERIQEVHRLRLLLKTMVCLDPASTIVAARRAAGLPAPEVEMIGGQAPSSEQQVFKAVVGHVVGGGLLPEHCQEVMDMLWPTWMLEREQEEEGEQGQEGPQQEVGDVAA